MGRLGSFVDYMRSCINRDNKGGLSQERIDRLDDLGFNWSRMSKKWLKKFEELEKYKQEHGSFTLEATHPLK